MNWHSKTAEETGLMLNTDAAYGLSDNEAEKRLEEYGKNTIESSKKRKGPIARFFAQLNDIMIIILLAASAASFGVSLMNGEADFTDSIIIIAIVILNAVMGVVQESRAEKAVEELKKMSAPKARVLRGGKIKEIDSEYIVPGDILVLEAGDMVGADARIVECSALMADESALTGESHPVSKNTDACGENTPVADRHDMVYSSTYVTGGRGKAMAVSTGMNTEVGKIASMIDDGEKNETPLQKRLDNTGKILGMTAIGICAVIFVIGIMRKYAPFDMFMTSISLAVAAIPEGLPAIVTIVLAIGTQTMSKKNTIVRTLPAVETLGSAEVICTDKTGTLTKNKMKAVKIRGQGDKMSLNDKKFVIRLAALCTDCRYEDRRYVGEPTEVAVVEAAEEMGEKKERLEAVMPRIDEIPFSSERKMMTTVHDFGTNEKLCITKGAPERVLKLCTYISPDKRMDKRTYAELEKADEDMAASGLRVLAVAYKQTAKNDRQLEKDLVFAGFIGMTDPPRDEAAGAVAECAKAGIRVVMITGDHALTAKAIASQTGIYRDGSLIVTGTELDNMDDKLLDSKLEDISVFARVSPEHKLKIVEAFKRKGKIVAMTGDGVNDAPALKKADIGCAMGGNGTDVAKGASDMIITDDNFATIVSAVREGRIIYGNIRKSVHFLLSSNIGEIMTVFIAMLFGWGAPLLPIHLLWVNLITDSLPAVALGLDRPEDDVMKKGPASADSSLFSDGLGQRIAFEGIMIGTLALMAFGAGRALSPSRPQETARTMAFAVLSLSQLVHAFNMRTEGSVFGIHIFSNVFLCFAFIIGTIMQAAVISVPVLAEIFSAVPLNAVQWAVVAGLSLVPILFVEFEKAMLKTKQ